MASGVGPRGVAVYGRPTTVGKPLRRSILTGERSNLLPPMRFFFLEEEPPGPGTTWKPPRGLLRHLSALRLEAGSEFLLLPPSGGATQATLTREGTLEIGSPCTPPRLPLADDTLATAWPKGPRADELVVRATEAGVRRILPLHCTRSVAGREPFPVARMERWQRLMRETCQQTRNPTLPELQAVPCSLAEAQAAVPDARPVALLPGTWPLMMELELHPAPARLLYVGPEGGFDDHEEQWFRDHQVACAGLLPTILRIEAAGPAAITLVQHHALRQRGH